MKILGIDPGYAILGYGVVEKTGNRFRACRYGAVTTDAGMPMTERLEYLYDSLREIIDEERPDVASIEQLFFNTNAKTAIMVGQARGVAVLACVKGGLEVEEYTPLLVKTILNLKEIPKPDDTADALAAAICHGHSADTRKRLKELGIR